MSRIFTDPIAQVIIRDIEEGIEWQWGSPQFPFLTSVNFNWEMEAINVFSVGVDIPYDLALEYTNIKKTPFKKNNVVMARIGYASGGFTDWESGYLADGGKGLGMNADGLSGSLQVTWVSPKVARYTIPKTILREAGTDGVSLLQKIASEINLGIYLSNGAIKNLNAWQRQARPTVLSGRLEMFNGFANMDIMDVVSALCRRSNLKFWMGKKSGIKTLFVAQESEKLKGDFSDGTIRNYVIRGILDETKNQYPCYSADPSDDSLSWLERSPSGSASGVTAWTNDTETGDDIKFDSDPKDNEIPVDGQVENPAPADIKSYPDNTVELIADAVKGDESLGSYMSAPIMPSGKEVFENQAREFGLQGDPAIEINIQTIGIPEESPGNTCNLWGAGDLLNGRYFIEGLTHSWTPGNWDMTIKGRRRGVKAAAGQKVETAGGQMDQ